MKEIAYKCVVVTLLIAVYLKLDTSVQEIKTLKPNVTVRSGQVSGSPCEYVFIEHNNNLIGMSHKGDCKVCIERAGSNKRITYEILPTNTWIEVRMPIITTNPVSTNLISVPSK